MPCLPPRRSSSRRCWWNRYSDSGRPHRQQARPPLVRVADARAEPKLARAEPKLARVPRQARVKGARVAVRVVRVVAVAVAAAAPELRLPPRRETRRGA